MLSRLSINVFTKCLQNAAWWFVLVLLPGLMPALHAQVDPLGRSILFVRGADGTGGATEGGTPAQRTEQLSDVHNLLVVPGNHGYGYLKLLLEQDGFTVKQIVESATPITLAILGPHRVVVLGSNNRPYTAAEVQALHDYLDLGGSTLFISDANWGSTWEAAPASDNTFLARYGVQVYQDAGQVPTMNRSEPGRYVIPDHPVLSGPDGVGGTSDVAHYNGEGVSLFRITTGSSGYQAVPLVSAAGLLKRLNNPTGQPGALEPAIASDAAMVVVEKGDTRLVGHFDRNTFFNQNGAGTDLTRLDNAQLALNLFRFLASVPATVQTAGQGCGLHGPVSLAANRPVPGRTLTFSLTNATARVPGWFVVTPGDPVPQKLPGGCELQVAPGPFGLFVPFVTDAAGAWSFNLGLPADHRLSGLRLTAQAATFVAGGPLPGGGELSNGLALRLGYPR